MNKIDFNAQLAAIHQQLPAAERRPVVGISGNYGEQTCKIADAYYKQIVNAGGTPLIIPPVDDENVINATLDSIDALLLSGGADINPLIMGEEPEPRLGGINAERDMPELLLTRIAYHRQIPILGICRGIQTLAVALGGKVAQDIATISGTVTPGGIKHSQDADRQVPTHSVAVADSSLLHSIYGSDRLYVNSFHHQAVSEPGPHLIVTATAPDGIIEAVESSELKPIVGVQWHPEGMGDDGLPLFRWLVDEARLFQQAKAVHSRTLTLDTHCDTPMLFPQGVEFSRRDDRLLVDLHKMNEGRLDATIMVAYLPQKGWKKENGKWTCVDEGLKFEGSTATASNASPSGPKAYADSIFDRIEQTAARSNGRLSVARSLDELWANKRAGRKSIILGIENGLALEDSLENLDHFARRGVVYITLCHNGDNSICDSAKGDSTWGGMSPFGADVIRRMNELGIVVDLSHAHERSFYDALDISRLPIVCSHSSARALCDHPRNLNDEQMRALAAKGGVCQVTLYHGFLTTPPTEATIYDAMAHLDHAISVMGIDHVGLGTDFDGDGGVRGLADASEMINFTRQLLKRHYSDDSIQKIWGGNFMRVISIYKSSQNT